MALEFIQWTCFCAMILGYIYFGCFSKTFWRAVSGSFLWGLALFILLSTLGSEEAYGLKVPIVCGFFRGLIFETLNVDIYSWNVFGSVGVCLVLNLTVAVVWAGGLYLRGLKPPPF